MINFENISYLKSGNSRQKKAYDLFAEKRIMESLQEFSPLLAGTIPINIDIESSDLDILCHWTDKQFFAQKINTLFGKNRHFKIHESQKFGAVIANFEIDDFKIEIFGQNIPTEQQAGYRHMIIEYHILEKFGEDFRLQIIELKKQGLKTEPAFGKLLGIEGDVYQELLNYKVGLD